MKILFNYAHNKFYGSQLLNTKSGYETGGFDKVFQYGFNDIDSKYYDQNKLILDQKEVLDIGYGNIILERLLNDNNITEGSYVFYSDSGCVFTDSINNLISVMDRDKISIMTFRQNHMSYICTKRDTFILTNTDEPKYTHTGQRCGGWFLLKKNDDKREFINQCYGYSLDYRIITDAPNELGQNYEGFYDHRHDESLISIVSKKWDLFPYRNPSQWGYLSDVDFTNNMYGEKGLKTMVEKFGPISTWKNKYKPGSYLMGESLNQYPNFYIDDKSTYPTIIELHRNPN